MRSDTLSIIAGFFALFALDLGVLFWIAMLDKANGEDQARVATIMIIVDLAGAIVGMLADTLLVGADAGTRDFVGFVAQWVVPSVIGANVVAGVVYKLKDPTRQEEMEHRAMQRSIEREREKARLEVERAQADAEITLERARVSYIRQNSALEMLTQARNMLGETTIAFSGAGGGSTHNKTYSADSGVSHQPVIVPEEPRAPKA